MVLFPALFHRDGLPGLRRKGWAAALWAAGFAANEALYFYHYQKPVQHRPFSELWWGCFEQPLRTAQFFFSFLGSPLAGGTGHPQAAATVIGLVLSALFLGACVWIFRFRADRELVGQARPWLVIGAYAVLSAGLTTSTRSAQFGVAEALSSRYGMYATAPGGVGHPPCAAPCLSVAGAPARVPSTPVVTQFVLALAAASLFWLHALAFPAGAWAMRSTWEYRVLGKSCLAFINVIPEQRHLTELLCPNYGSLKQMANSLLHELRSHSLKHGCCPVLSLLCIRIIPECNNKTEQNAESGATGHCRQGGAATTDGHG